MLKPAYTSYIAFCLLLSLAAFGRADADWLVLSHPRPLDAGKVAFGLSLRQAQRQSWAGDSVGYWMVDVDGVAKTQSQIDIEAQLRWQVTPRLMIEADAPVGFSELSPYTADDSYTAYRLDDPSLRRSQGLGDLRLGLRGALYDREEGANAGWLLTLTAPTGLGPFEAPQATAGTGEGRWQLQPGLVAGGVFEHGEAWLQVLGRVQFGTRTVSNPQAFISYDANGGRSLGSGSLWLGPRYGVDASAGFAWIWLREEGARHSLGMEVLAHSLSPWNSGGDDPFLAPERSLALLPQLQSRFGRFTALAGWQAFLWADQLPSADRGEFLLKASYVF